MIIVRLIYVPFLLSTVASICTRITGSKDTEKETDKFINIQRRPTKCPNAMMCVSRWGFCGLGEPYCGKNCVEGPCWNHNHSRTIKFYDNNQSSIITEENFACVFNNIDNFTRLIRFRNLKDSGWTPATKEEAAIFLAHVAHETDGLKTIKEYCAPSCGYHYASSWCHIQGKPGKLYYGRGWFQLSWPCNYYAAGKALGIDLLNNPDLVEQRQDLAVKTAVWFYKANNMVEAAQQGDFASTTRIINGAVECNGRAGYAMQMTRITTYKRIRQCFDLGEPTRNLLC